QDCWRRRRRSIAVPALAFVAPGSRQIRNYGTAHRRIGPTSASILPLVRRRQIAELPSEIFLSRHLVSGPWGPSAPSLGISHVPEASAGHGTARKSLRSAREVGAGPPTLGPRGGQAIRGKGPRPRQARGKPRAGIPRDRIPAPAARLSAAGAPRLNS